MSYFCIFVTSSPKVTKNQKWDERNNYLKIDYFSTKFHFISDHPVCKNIAVLKGTDFPKDKYNVKFHAEHKNITGEIVIVNHRVVFIDDSQNTCIWWHETGLWWIGKIKFDSFKCP